MTKKIGRNQPCPCGSGKKFKKCCSDKTRTAPVENVPVSTWDYVTRWFVRHKEKDVTIVKQMAVTIDRETGEKFPEPYIALMLVDGRSVRALTRKTKIEVCRKIAMEKCA